MSAPLFSIVIPTFNYGRFLTRAIDSVLRQRGEDYELAVVDDGSTDDTPSVAAAYGAPVRYLRQERRGVFLACKHGLEATTGRYLVFFDADDALAPGALACLRQEIERRPGVGLVAGRHVNVTVAGRRPSAPLALGPSREANFRSFLLGRLDICTGAAAIRREAVALLRRHDGTLRVGAETACVAQTLWLYDAAAVDRVLLEVHDHPGRLRDNLSEIRQAGEALVDVVFDREILPPAAERHRDMFRARLLRDRARSYHRAGLDADAVRQFHEAFRSDPGRTLRDGRNLRRYVVSQTRLRLAPRPLETIAGRPSREPGVVEAGGAERWWGHRRQLRACAHEFLRRCSELGDVVKLRLARPTYLLSDPRDILHVFVEQPGRYRRTGLQAAFRQLFGRGLFSRTGRSHIEQRRTLQPLLHRGRLDGFVPPLVRTLGEFLPNWTSGQTVDVSGTLMDVTMRASARMILGVEQAEDAAELFTAIHGSHQRVVRNMQSMVRLPDWLPTKRRRTLKSHIGRLDAVMGRLIAAARAGESDGSLLGQLVRLRDEAGKPLDDRQIRDHALTIFLAAYEPPATGLAWILYLLARHPEWQRHLQAEIDADLSGRGAGGLPPAVAWAQRPAMSQVISEAMRLYPSTWLLTRRAAERDVLPGGATIPSGAEVLASPLLIHRSPRRFDEPGEFRPERFEGGTTEHRAAGTYFPFGLGPTACLGEYLARLMMAVTVDAVVSRFILEDANDAPPQIYSQNLFTMQADRPIQVRLVARDAVAGERRPRTNELRAA